MDCGAKGAKKTALFAGRLAASGGFQDWLTAEDPTRRVRLHGGKESKGCKENSPDCRESRCVGRLSGPVDWGGPDSESQATREQRERRVQRKQLCLPQDSLRREAFRTG